MAESEKWTLTEEHQKQIPAWNKKWTDIIMSTDLIDFDKTKDAVLKMYKAAELDDNIEVTQALSPMMGAVVWAAASVHYEKKAS